MGRWLLLALALIAALAAVARLTPDPQARLLRPPADLPIILMSVAIATTAAATAARRLPLARLEQAAALLTSVTALALAALGILSIERFMALDLPDEPWLAATAVNYAISGSLAAPERAWVYAITEPVLQRYYVLMGLWLRALNDTSLLALRAFPLLIGILAAALTANLLWRTPELRPYARRAGLCALLAFTPFVRASHNLRADIGLAIYGVVLLWALTRPLNRRSAFLAGVGLWVGLESLPTTAAAAAAAGGLVLLTTHWRTAIAYGLGTLTALGLYSLRFAADPAGSLLTYSRFIQFYDQTGLIGLRPPWEPLLNYHLRFGAILSPAEIGLFGLALVGLWQGARRAALTLLAGGLLMISSFTVSYGYWAIFAPFAAYGTALAVRRRTLLAATLILIPAAALAPLRDMGNELLNDGNHRLLEQIDLMTGQFPPGSVVAGDEVFWFTLHPGRTFFGWIGLERFAAVNELTLDEALTVLEADVAICDDQQTARCASLRRNPLFDQPVLFQAGDSAYWIFKRRAP